MEGSPTIVKGEFNCSGNRLKSLEYGPTTVGGKYDCSFNPLTNLVGAPITVGGNFRCGTNDKTTLLTGITIKQINGDFIITGWALGLMALFKIKGIKKVYYQYIGQQGQDIINTHITNPRGALAFQAEMISNGFKAYL